MSDTSLSARGSFGSKRYPDVVEELVAAGTNMAGIRDIRSLYLAFGLARGLDFPSHFLPSVRQSKRALALFRRTGVLAVLSKQVLIPAVGIEPSTEDVMALASQAKRTTTIIRLFSKQGGKCHYCDGEMLLDHCQCLRPNYATIDHIVPRSKGGTLAEGNGVAACARCNSEKGDMEYHHYMATRSNRVVLELPARTGGAA